VPERDKRLAVEVNNNPLDYGAFEGTLPKGPLSALMFTPCLGPRLVRLGRGCARQST